MQHLSRLTFVASLLGILIANSVAWSDTDLAREELPDAWKAEAELTDVFFLNPNLGWAVGAQGVIVRTSDGGKNWSEISQVPNLVDNNMSLNEKIRNMQSGKRTRSTGVANDGWGSSPIRVRFESVCFVNEQYGWVAGGYDVPYVGRSRAVVMRTSDGGLSWNSVGNLVVPRFNRIHFADARNGWAIGKSGNLFQSGTFFTSDGGLSWSSQQSSASFDDSNSWIDGQKTKSGFATINYDGRLGLIQGDTYEPSVILRDGGARMSKLQMVDNTTGWAAGENGTLLKTENGGLSWSAEEMPEIGELVSKFDLKTVFSSRTKTWFGGDPGSFLFCFDQTTGKTTTHRTPIDTRINEVHFVDDLTGWAVGSFGTIIATTDGGQNWQIQRGQNRRAAMLCVALDAQSLPLEILSRYATEESRICASLILSGTEPDNQIATQAIERLGSVATVTIDLRPNRLATITPSDRHHQVMAKIVRTIRTIRPNVIVCNAGQSFSSMTASSLSNPVTLLNDAVRMAADTNSFADQLQAQDLGVWQVERLAILDPTGTITLDPSRLLPRTGMLIEDQIAVSRGLVELPVSNDAPLKYRVTHFTNRDRMKAGDLLSGLDSRNEAPSRASRNEKRGNLTMIQKANAKHKQFEQFAKFNVNTPQDLQVWQQQVQAFAMSMEQDVAGVWLMQLMEQYLESGKTELAASAASMLVSYTSDHAFAPACLTWLAQYYASDEFAQIELRKRVSSGQLQRNGELTTEAIERNKFTSIPQTIRHDGTSHHVWVPTQAMVELEQRIETGSDFQVAVPNDETKEVSPYARPSMFDDRLKTASRYLSQLSQRDPELIAGPQYKLLEAQITRRLNGAASTEGRFKSLVQQRNFKGAGVSIGAQRELGLGGLTAPTATPVNQLKVVSTDQRPNLDGVLDESFWQTAIASGNVLQPKVQADGPSDTVVFAFDDQFLYAGFICQKIKGQYYISRKQARPRDADLERRDRVEFAIDVDRDYRSVNRFVIDHRGWVRESCTGSIGWNPDWYVSQSEDESSWTVEVAIPLEQIIPGQIEPDSSWAFQVARRAYQHQDLWSDRPDEGLIRTGFQLGLESRPADFDLIQFLSRESIAEDSPSGSVVPASFESSIERADETQFDTRRQ